MDAYDVVVWEDSLSDGSLAYSAWCAYVLGVSGQGDTEGDALADILSAMAANVFDPWPADSPIFQDTQTAADEMAELMRELGDDGTNYRLHRVTKDDLRAAYRPVSDAVPVA